MGRGRRERRFDDAARLEEKEAGDHRARHPEDQRRAAEIHEAMAQFERLAQPREPACPPRPAGSDGHDHGARQPAQQDGQPDALLGEGQDHQQHRRGDHRQVGEEESQGLRRNPLPGEGETGEAYQPPAHVAPEEPVQPGQGRILGIDNASAAEMEGVTDAPVADDRQGQSEGHERGDAAGALGGQPPPSQKQHP